MYNSPGIYFIMECLKINLKKNIKIRSLRIYLFQGFVLKAFPLEQINERLVYLNEVNSQIVKYCLNDPIDGDKVSLSKKKLSLLEIFIK